MLCVYTYIKMNIWINDRKWPNSTAKRIPTYGRVFVTYSHIMGNKYSATYMQSIILYRTAVAYNVNNATA